MVSDALACNLIGVRNTPFFVVMTMTPFAALAPHILEAEASLRMVMFSTILGLILLRSPSYGKLSTTIKGFLGPLIVLSPRTII
ncbi:hypothetical protein D3C81_1123980 [compost metagenome]